MIGAHCEMGFHGHFYAENFSGDSGIYTEEIRLSILGIRKRTMPRVASCATNC